MTSIKTARTSSSPDKATQKRAVDAVRPKRPVAAAGADIAGAPAAGAHAATHLTNHDATPGCGALPSAAHVSGREVDGGAG